LHIANDGLPTIGDVDVLYANVLLAAVAADGWTLARSASAR
jgi:hypothetical protein